MLNFGDTICGFVEVGSSFVTEETVRKSVSGGGSYKRKGGEGCLETAANFRRLKFSGVVPENLFRRLTKWVRRLIWSKVAPET